MKFGRASLESRENSLQTQNSGNVYMAFNLFKCRVNFLGMSYIGRTRIILICLICLFGAV